MFICFKLLRSANYYVNFPNLYLYATLNNSSIQKQLTTVEIDQPNSNKITLLRRGGVDKLWSYFALGKEVKKISPPR